MIFCDCGSKAELQLVPIIKDGVWDYRTCASKVVCPIATR